MDFTEGVADLHLHTTASDGTCSVGERVEQAADRGLQAIAITDHDCIDDELGQRVDERAGVEVITGVEVRGDVSGTKIELLGYYVDPEAAALRSALEGARNFRRERNRAMVEALAEATELDFEYDRLVAEVDGMLGRPHLAGALVDAGVVDSVGAAFDRYLGTGGEAYVPMERVPATVVIEAIERAGGVSSLAHPGRTRTDDLPGVIDVLVDAGLDGIEVWYPYDDAPQSPDYADVGVEGAAALAADHGLLRTGGSDCHGPGSGKFRIGDVRIPSVALDAVRDRAAERRPL